MNPPTPREQALLDAVRRWRVRLGPDLPRSVRKPNRIDLRFPLPYRPGFGTELQLAGGQLSSLQ
jgi:hypothetical protein